MKFISGDFRKWVTPIVLLFIFISSLAIIQFSTPDLPDNDGFYHIKLAQVMRNEGIVPEFRWLPNSILNSDDFYDHHFLFHIALIPFTYGDLRLGAKWAAVIFPALSFLMIYFLFRRQRVPHPWLWALSLLSLSEAFLYRMSITRAQSLSLGFLALGMLWLLERKNWHLAVLAFLYVWTYNAFPLLLVMGILFGIASYVIDRKFQWESLTFICVGILAGLVINPYFPQNLVFISRHILPKLGDLITSGLGNEWHPYNTTQLLENSLPALLAFLSGAFALGLSDKKIDARTVFAFLLAIFFGFMLFRARRFVEYFPPFSLIFAAFAWTPLKKKVPFDAASGTSVKNKPSRFWQFLFISIPLVGIFGYTAISGARQLIQTSKPYNLYQDAAQWLAHNTPEGMLIFQTDWDDFPRLFYYNTHNTYLTGLDPTFFQQYDPALFDLWVEITRGRVDFPSKAIIENFNTTYVHTDLQHENFIRKASDDPNMIEVFRDDQAVIFQIVESAN